MIMHRYLKELLVLAFAFISCAAQPLDLTLYKINGRQLVEAAETGRIAEAETLLRNGVDPNKFTKYAYATAIHIAASRGDINLLKLLKKYGADLDFAAAPNRSTPLFDAASTGQYLAVSYLLENGADIKRFLGPQQYTVLHVAAGARSPHNSIEVLKILIRHGANVNATADNLESVLDSAVNADNFQAIDLLIMSGADQEHKGPGGATAIASAVLGQDVKSIAVLLKHRVSLSNLDEVWGFSPLHYAARKGNLEIAEMLVRAGANAGQMSADGRLPEEVAQKEGYSEIAKYLRDVRTKHLSNKSRN